MAEKADSEKQPLTQQGQVQEQSCFLRHAGLVAKLWGLVTLAVIWAAAVTLLQGNYKDAPQYAQYYLLAVGILVSFFEFTWILDKTVCCLRVGLCCKIWVVVLWVDKWRKFILYTALTVPLFLQGMRVIIGVISGFCLLVLACLYLINSFRNFTRAPLADQAAVTSVSSVVRHEMSTQTERASTNPFEEEEWSEEETPQQRREREQRQKQLKEKKRQQQEQEQQLQQQQQQHQEQRQQQQETLRNGDAVPDKNQTSE